MILLGGKEVTTIPAHPTHPPTPSMLPTFLEFLIPEDLQVIPTYLHTHTHTHSFLGCRWSWDIRGRETRSILLVNI